MAFDGYFPPKKTVFTPSKPHPKAPGGQRPRPSRPSYQPPKSDPYRRRSRQPLGPSKGPAPQPSYGTAVPAVDNLINGIPRHMQYARWLLPKLARTHPWIRGAGIAMDLAELSGWNPDRDPFPSMNFAFNPSASFEGGGRRFCGRPGEVAITAGLGTSAMDQLCRLMPIPGQAIGSAIPNPSHRGIQHYDDVYYIGETPRGTLVGAELYPRAPAVPGPTRTAVKVSLEPLAFAPFAQQRLMQPNNKAGFAPHQLVPYAPTAPDMRLGTTRFSHIPGPSNTAAPITTRAPDPTVGRKGPHPSRPAPRRTRERKGKIPKWFAFLAARAWDVTEANDLAENLFECLPKEVQKNAPKTGRTHRGSWAGEGHRYTSIVDKGRHVYDNLDLLDLDCSFRKVSCNHIMDMLWGRFFGTVDKGFQRGGVSGYSFGTRGSGADVPFEEYEKFLKWVEANPRVDSLIKSLDCENLGRS